MIPAPGSPGPAVWLFGPGLPGPPGPAPGQNGRVFGSTDEGFLDYLDYNIITSHLFPPVITLDDILCSGQHLCIHLSLGPPSYRR